VEHYESNSEYHCDGGCDAVEDEPDCVPGVRHLWRGVGGCDSNPGVWSIGGTAYRYVAECIVCGCRRTATCFGGQRNPGQCDTVRFEGGGEDAAVLDTPAARVEAVRQRRNARRRAARRAARQVRRVTLAD
jgi:hypothetical protein